jgi:molecular chaperone GrpE
MKKSQPEKTILEKRLDELAREAAEEEQAQAATEVEGDVPEDGGEPAPAQETPAGVSEELVAVAAERDELKDQLLRARAEFDNYRKRMAREAERTRSRAAEGLIHDLLPVLDHLGLALQHSEETSNGLAEGVEMVFKQFGDVLAKNGLTPIPAEGETFDPTVHEAILQTPSEEVPANGVLQEFQKGYRLGDFVLRPAKVVVSAGPAEPTGADAAAQAGEETETEPSESPTAGGGEEDATADQTDESPRDSTDDTTLIDL